MNAKTEFLALMENISLYSSGIIYMLKCRNAIYTLLDGDNCCKKVKVKQKKTTEVSRYYKLTE